MSTMSPCLHPLVFPETHRVWNDFPWGWHGPGGHECPPYGFRRHV